jgi:hypothetical protein
MKSAGVLSPALFMPWLPAQQSLTQVSTQRVMLFQRWVSNPSPLPRTCKGRRG